MFFREVPSILQNVDATAGQITTTRTSRLSNSIYQLQQPLQVRTLNHHRFALSPAISLSKKLPPSMGN
jgi:hypothetical protein